MRVDKHPIYQLSSDIVDELASTFPDLATEVGIVAHNDRWTDVSPEGSRSCAAQDEGVETPG